MFSKKCINELTTQYVYDNEDIVLELDENGIITRQYIHGPWIDEPLIMEYSGQKLFYHADGLGSITELSNSGGSVVQAYVYDSFGNIAVQSGNTPNIFTYTGNTALRS